MSAPIVTDAMREWAAAFTAAVETAAKARGTRYDQTATEQLIRDALTNPKWDRRDIIEDPDLDHGYTRGELERLADFEASRDWGNRTGGNAA